MKVDHQENCEFRFSLTVIGFHRYYRFFLFRFNFSQEPIMASCFSEKRNGQEISFVRDERKGIKKKTF